MTDQDIDDFLEHTFNDMFAYFQTSLEQLQQELSRYTSCLKGVDSDTFTAQLYSNGHAAAECMVFMGGIVMSRSNSINYSNKISSSKNSINDSLTVSQTKDGLFFKALGFGLQFGSQVLLDSKAAADYYWLRFISAIESGR